MHAIIQSAPKLIDYLSDESSDHFKKLCRGLEALQINYTINPFLVRGLDYYEQTVFEWVTDKLGAKATVCAGGRFDKLVELLGGPTTAATGFAIGVDRLLILLNTLNVLPTQDEAPFIFFVIVGQDEIIEHALVLSEMLRNKTNFKIWVHTGGGNFKSQFKKAGKSGARFALILGEDEFNQQLIGIKDLHQQQEQVTIPQSELTSYLEHHMR